MCVSPEDMTSKRIEEIIRDYKEQEAKTGRDYSWYREEFEKVLKERMENGTYATDGKAPRGRSGISRG